MTTSSAAVRHVLLAVDGNEHSERAFHWYVEHLAKPGDMLTLLQVIPHHGFNAVDENLVAFDQQPAPDGSNRDQVAKAQALQAEYAEKLRQKLDNQEASLSLNAASQPNGGHHRLRGQLIQRSYVKRCTNIGAGIVDAQAQLRVDMIVMGTRSLNMLKRTFLGSVSDYVLHHALVPVAVIPPPADNE